MEFLQSFVNFCEVMRNTSEKVLFIPAKDFRSYLGMNSERNILEEVIKNLEVRIFTCSNFANEIIVLILIRISESQMSRSNSIVLIPPVVS